MTDSQYVQVLKDAVDKFGKEYLAEIVKEQVREYAQTLSKYALPAAVAIAALILLLRR